MRLPPSLWAVLWLPPALVSPQNEWAENEWGAPPQHRGGHAPSPEATPPSPEATPPAAGAGRAALCDGGAWRRAAALGGGGGGGRPGAAMLLTVFCLRRDRSELTFSLQVDADFELQNFRALCELESGIPAAESQVRARP